VSPDMDCYDDKKVPLLPTDQDRIATAACQTNKLVKDKRRSTAIGAFRGFLLFLLLFISVKSTIRIARRHVRHSYSWYNDAAPICPQTTALIPTASIAKELSDLYLTEEFKQKAVEWLSGAVQVKYVIRKDWLLARDAYADNAGPNLSIR
jgi:hypothetical protein